MIRVCSSKHYNWPEFYAFKQTIILSTILSIFIVFHKMLILTFLILAVTIQKDLQ